MRISTIIKAGRECFPPLKTESLLMTTSLISVTVRQPVVVVHYGATSNTRRQVDYGYTVSSISPGTRQITVTSGFGLVRKFSAEGVEIAYKGRHLPANKYDRDVLGTNVEEFRAEDEKFERISAAKSALAKVKVADGSPFYCFNKADLQQVVVALEDALALARAAVEAI